MLLLLLLFAVEVQEWDRETSISGWRDPLEAAKTRRRYPQAQPNTLGTDATF